MVLPEFSMALLTQGKSVSAYVARSLDIIDKSGLPYQFTSMGSITNSPPMISYASGGTTLQGAIVDLAAAISRLPRSRPISSAKC